MGVNLTTGDVIVASRMQNLSERVLRAIRPAQAQLAYLNTAQVCPLSRTGAARGSNLAQRSHMQRDVPRSCPGAAQLSSQKTLPIGGPHTRIK